MSESWGSPNAVPTMLAQMVLRLSQQLTERDPDLVRQDALVSIFLGMTTIEAFVNSYGLIVADEVEAGGAAAIQKSIKRDNTNNKLKTLFIEGFKLSLNEADDRWLEFQTLRELRNHLVHFKSTHTTLEFPEIIGKMRGMADLQEWEKLTAETAAWVLKTIFGLMGFVAEGRGMAKKEAKGLVHLYTGIPQMGDP